MKKEKLIIHLHKRGYSFSLCGVKSRRLLSVNHLNIFDGDNNKRLCHKCKHIHKLKTKR